MKLFVSSVLITGAPFGVSGRAYAPLAFCSPRAPTWGHQRTATSDPAETGCRESMTTPAGARAPQGRLLALE